VTTLSQHLAAAQLPAGLPAVIEAFAQASLHINHALQTATLAGHTGAAGNVNVQGEDQQKLDVLSDEWVSQALMASGQVCVYGSEEQDGVVVTPHEQAPYAVLFDPLDGSSNIDVGISVGTIFAIYKRQSTSAPAGLADCLQPGRQQVAAGYILYSTGVFLVLTTGNGVQTFTLDPATRQYVLTTAHVTQPTNCTYLSINESKPHEFEPGLAAYLAQLRERCACGQSDVNCRYIGALVADFHRNLLKGGLFIYPGTRKKPEGKLRLLYEGNPMAFLMEQAGGAASNGVGAILDLQPTTLHQRTPLFLGTKTEIERIAEHMGAAV